MANKKSCLPNNVIMGVYEGTIHLYQKRTLKKNKPYYAAIVASSNSGVARLELYENEKHSLTLQPTFMVVGDEVVKVERITLAAKEMKNAFLISTRDHHYTFFVETSDQCDQWVKCIQETLLEEALAIRTPSSKSQTIVSEVNEIYESVNGVSQQINEFVVNTNEATRTRIGVFGDVKLVVEDESICIITLACKLIVRWNLKDIRKFSFTSKAFFVEAGRKSTLGPGDFVFLTDKGERIHSIINIKRRLMKEKMEATKCQPKVATSPPPAPTPKPMPPAPTPKPMPPAPHQYAPRMVDPESYCSSGIYDMPEELMLSSSAKHKPPHAGNTCSRQLPSSPTRSNWSSSASQGINASVVNIHSTEVATNQEIINQTQMAIYSEPEMIRDAWKSYGCDDSEDAYSYDHLDFSKLKVSQELKSYYGYTETATPPVDARQNKQQTPAEDIYAEVDKSKKCKNRK